jgi:hypothetical protein
MFFHLKMTYAEYKVQKINRLKRLWYYDKGILYLKSFTCGLAKSFYVKSRSHNLRINLHMGSNSVWFDLIFGYGIGGQFCPQNSFHYLLNVSALFLLLHLLHLSLFTISISPKCFAGPKLLERNTECGGKINRGNCDD